MVLEQAEAQSEVQSHQHCPTRHGQHCTRYTGTWAHRMTQGAALIGAMGH